MVVVQEGNRATRHGTALSLNILLLGKDVQHVTVQSAYPDVARRWKGCLASDVDVCITHSPVMTHMKEAAGNIEHSRDASTTRY
jgi:hypothetical protein